MGKQLDWLLIELDRQARSQLPPEQARELMLETRAHLDSAIQARMELGQEPQHAEEDAVAAYGMPEVTVTQMHEVYKTTSPSPNMDRRWLAVAALSCVAPIVYATLDLQLSAALVPFGLALVIPAVLWASWGTNRIQWRNLALIYFPLTVVLTVMYACLWMPLGYSRIPIYRWSSTLNEVSYRMEVVQAAIQTPIRKTEDGWYEVVQPIYWPSVWEDAQRYNSEFPTLKQANDYWAQNGSDIRRENHHAIGELRKMRRDLLSSHANRSLARSVQLFVQVGIGTAMSFMALLFGLNLVAWKAKRILNQVRRPARTVERA